ncbi:MAG: hypothetical protein IT579_19670 [Verrucomicrobia subdivision 3 bacterium]|nr:hypothetical protein [Limisphaerales bacterium]
MKQLIFKELREQFKVAVLGLVILTLMVSLAFAAYGTQLQQVVWSMGQKTSDSLQPLLRNDLLIQVSFFCAIFGTLLGWLQIRAEKHPDLWAFLVHRPIPRTTILRSKVVAGLLLYLAGTGLPLFGLILVVSIPGNVAAPFEWAMALPLTSICLVGMVYYFAGLLTGLRQARWFASRGFGLGLAVIANCSLFAMPEFWHALLIIVVAGTLLALTVWGSFQTGGFYRDQPVAGKVALTLASTASVLVLIGLLFALSINFLASRGGYTYSHYQLTREGKILRVTQRGFDEADITDLDGQPVLDEKNGRKITLKDLQQRYAQGVSASVDVEQRARRNNQVGESFFNLARFFSPWRVQDKILWYLTADGRLVGYHGISRRYAGTLVPRGTGGSGVVDDSRFLLPQNYRYSYLNNYNIMQPGVLASAKTAYVVDLEKRELKPLLTVTNGDAIHGFSEATSVIAPATNASVLILTRKFIRLLDLEGGTKLQLPYMPSFPQYPTVSVFRYELTNFVVRLEPDYFENKISGGKLLSRVEWVNQDGSIRNAKDLPKLPEPAQNSRAERFLIPLMPPPFPPWSWDEPYRIWNLLRILPAALCVGVGWWLGRRNNFTPKALAGWGIFHLLLGLPGFLAFLAVQEWPATEPCPGCKKMRVVDRESCEHCGVSFAPSEKTGTEIFEPLI